MQAAQPSLYRLAEDGTLRLLLGHCRHCGQHTFPANAPGCRACGRPLESSDAIERPASATLDSFVQVHVAVVPGLRVPHLSAQVELLPGLMVGAALADSPGRTYHPGMALLGQAEPVPGTETYGCVFAPVAGDADE